MWLVRADTHTHTHALSHTSPRVPESRMMTRSSCGVIWPGRLHVRTLLGVSLLSNVRHENEKGIWETGSQIVISWESTQIVASICSREGARGNATSQCHVQVCCMHYAGTGTRSIAFLSPVSIFISTFILPPASRLCSCLLPPASRLPYCLL